MRARPVVLIGDTVTGIALTVTGSMYMRHMDASLPPDETTPPGQGSKVTYEYNNFYVGTQSRHHPDFIARMNQEGANGWLLAAVDSQYLYFVREIK